MAQVGDNMELYQSAAYWEDVHQVAMLPLPWEKLNNKTVVISGAGGLIGSFLVDVLMDKNQQGLNINLYVMGRNRERMIQRFSYWSKELLHFFVHDMNLPLTEGMPGRADYMLHLASNTHPIQYAKDPIGTIATNVIGLFNLLNYAADVRTQRFLFASSNEIYGENRGDVEFFDEHYLGYIDCNTMRAGYPESKRCGESLCQAFRVQRNLDVVIPRLTRSYGPTMLMTDTKAVSQFIKNALSGEDIVLKSKGEQYYSYTYVSDAVSGLLTVLLFGENGAAYNIADPMSDIMLKDLAALIAAQVDKKVVFDVPDAVEASGYSKASKARLKGDKIKELGWKPTYSIESGVTRTMTILREVYYDKTN